MLAACCLTTSGCAHASSTFTISRDALAEKARFWPDSAAAAKDRSLPCVANRYLHEKNAERLQPQRIRQTRQPTSS